jgi:cyclophilin family peptidyl-prolyl cis-trans isomerase
LEYAVDYERIYFDIIKKRQQEPPAGYSERHHVIPKSLGGSDLPTNIVRLTAREHFLCHYLLTKIYPSGNIHYKMIKAFGCMMWWTGDNHQRHQCNSRLYERLKKEHAVAMSRTQQGSNNSQFGSMWVNNGIESKKIKGDEDIPEGWERGRVKKVKPPKVKKKRVYPPGAVKQEKKQDYYTEEQKIQALLESNGNIRKALFALGLNDSGAHYKTMRKIKAAVCPLATNQLKG